MKVYIDVFTDDELISDSYKQLPPFEDASFSDVAFEVESCFISKGDEDYGIAANADADAEEGAAGEAGDGTVEQVIDVVNKFNLQEQYMDKKTFMAYIKKYMKNVCDHLEKNNPDRLNAFKTGGANLIKKVLGSFDDCNIYVGENASDGFAEFKALPVIARYAGEEPTPRFIFFVDGMREEKC